VAGDSPSPKSDNLRRLGTRLLAGGLVVAVLGVVVLVVGRGPIDVIGSLVTAVGALLALAGLGLVLSGLVGGRAAKDKPFA
jgi:hypothetical protein